MWGQDIGQQLLRDLPFRLRAAGFECAELYVYVDNVRAAALYQGMGWQPVGEPTPHPRRRKPEQLYELGL